MKCQHCGINFDDGDRECPICGASGGQPGRLSVAARRASSGRTEAPPRQNNGADHPERQVKKGPRGPEKERARHRAGFRGGGAFLQLAPAVFGLIGDFVGDIRFGSRMWSRNPVFGEADDWYEDDGARTTSYPFADLLGLRSVGSCRTAVYWSCTRRVTNTIRCISRGGIRKRRRMDHVQCAGRRAVSRHCAIPAGGIRQLYHLPDVRFAGVGGAGGDISYHQEMGDMWAAGAY